MQERKLFGFGTLLAGIVMLASGCGGLQIQYSPVVAQAAPPSTSVALQVVDNRPPDKLKHRNEVGQVRSGLGIPSGLEDKDVNVVPRTVTEATTDALRLASVGVGAGKVLVANITEFWMDGYMGYKAAVTVQYSLNNPAGTPLWSQEIKGAAGGSSFGSAGPNSMAKKLFEGALNDLANKASAEFKSQAFLAALAAP